jgi:spore maturation protein CgeB
MRRTLEDRQRLGGSVGFIGDYEVERASAIEYLSTNGIEVRVWGPNWAGKWKHRKKNNNTRIENKGLYGDDYARAICCFDINLAFLRKTARDQQTTRTMEITACGGFMLAERTKEHLELFEEGKEAEFFGSHKELLEKVRYYLQHDRERKRIAAAGRQRCLTSGYSNHDRLQKMLGLVANLQGLGGYSSELESRSDRSPKNQNDNIH